MPDVLEAPLVRPWNLFACFVGAVHTAECEGFVDPRFCVLVAELDVAAQAERSRGRRSQTVGADCLTVCHPRDHAWPSRCTGCGRSCPHGGVRGFR